MTSGDELLSVAEEYLAPLREADIDTLVLGCTHYPFLKGAISYVMGEQVSLVSSDVETANDVYRVLVSNGIERRATPRPATATRRRAARRARSSTWRTGSSPPRSRASSSCRRARSPPHHARLRQENA